MKKASSQQFPLIRSLSQSGEEKKNNGETAANSQQNNSIFIHKESVDQPVYKNSPISAIKEFREYENEADIREDPIFFRVVEKNNYSSASECEICKSAFNIFKSRKNCAFCGKAMCKSHLVKKRENPQNTSVFLKICEFCEEKYLNKIILDDFFQKKKKKEEETREVEKKLQEIKHELSIKQNEYAKAQTQREENEKLFQEKILLLSKNINKKKQQTDKIEEENKQLNDKDILINEKIKEEGNKSTEYKQELERLTKQCEDASKELTKVESEIKRITNLITETESKIQMYKFNKERKENGESNVQNNSMFISLISGEGSLVDLQGSVQRLQNSKLKDQPVEEKKSCCSLF